MSKYTRWIIKTKVQKDFQVTKWSERLKLEKRGTKETTVYRWKSYIFQIKYFKTHFERVWMCLVIIAKFLEKRWVDGQRNWTRNNSDKYEDRSVVPGEERVPCFPYSPTLHKDWFGFEEGLALQQRTELQAALVRTITKRCSLGIATMKHNATVERCRANNVITEWHNSAPWFVRFSVRSLILRLVDERKVRGVNDQKDSNQRLPTMRFTHWCAKTEWNGLVVLKSSEQQSNDYQHIISLVLQTHFTS